MIIKFPEPVHHVQENIIQFFFSQPHLREMWVAAGTKTGKTFAGAVGMSASMLQNKQKVNRWFAPIYIQSKIGMRYIKRFLPINRKDLFQCNESAEPSIIFKPNDNLLQFMHAQNPGGVEGEGTYINVLDECAKYKNGDDFYSSVKTTVTQTKGKILGISTPLGKSNFFYKKWKEAYDEMMWCLNNNRPVTAIALKAPTTINPTVSKEVLEEMKKRMPERLFLQFVMAEFLDDGSIFKDVLKSINDNNYVHTMKNGHAFWIHPDAKEMNVCIGADWGKKSDFTVFIAIESNDNIARIVGVSRFRKESYINASKKLKEFHECFKEVFKSYHDGTGVGIAIDDILNEYDVDTMPITFTNDNKNDMVLDLMLRFEKHTIEIPKWDILKEELDAYSVTVSKAGRFIYEADPTSGCHDDSIAALLLAMLAYKKGNISGDIIIPGRKPDPDWYFHPQLGDYVLTNEDELYEDFIM